MMEGLEDELYEQQGPVRKVKMSETDYRRMKNRCPNCSHRLEQVQGKRCTIILGDGRPGNDHQCDCRRHYRVVR